MNSPLNADASWDNTGTVACASMTADCLPVLFCDRAGTVVAAAHAGWRGLANGVLQNTIAAMGVAPIEIIAYLAPAIGAEAFEVGQDVWDAFCQNHTEAQSAFHSIGGGKYLADIYLLAKLILKREGVTSVLVANIAPCWNATAFLLPPRWANRAHGQLDLVGKMIWHGGISLPCCFSSLNAPQPPKTKRVNTHCATPM